MTHKETYNTMTYRNGCDAHSTKIIELDNKKKFKFVYRNGNAYEEFEGQIFDGDKLNHVFSMRDLGIEPDRSFYLLKSEIQTKERIETLTKKGIQLIKLLF